MTVDRQTPRQTTSRHRARSSAPSRGRNRPRSRSASTGIMLSTLMVLILALGLHVGCQMPSGSVKGRQAAQDAHAGFGTPAPQPTQDDVTPLHTDGSADQTQPESIPQGPRLIPASRLGAEEVWIIERAPTTALEPTAPRSLPWSVGGAMATTDARGRHIALPLLHTHIEATVTGPLAEVQLQQRFNNPFDRTIEAIYAFDLPDHATLHGFVLTIGQRRVHGIVREHDEAQRLYDAARHQGLRASLLTMEEAQRFVHRVHGIAPDSEISVTLAYLQVVPILDRTATLTLPTRIGSRLSDSVLPATLDDPPVMREQLITPTQRPARSLTVNVHFEPTMRISQVRSATHRIATQHTQGSRMQLRLAQTGGMVPNHDLVIEYQLDVREAPLALLATPDPRAALNDPASANIPAAASAPVPANRHAGVGYFALVMDGSSLSDKQPTTEAAQPAADTRADNNAAHTPIDLALIVDPAGLRSTNALAQRSEQVLIHQTLQHLRRSMQPGDTGVIYGRAPRIDGLRSIDPQGAQNVTQHLLHALAYLPDDGRQRVIVLISRGHFEHAQAVHHVIGRHRNRVRCLVLALPYDTHAHTLERLARTSQGMLRYLREDEHEPALAANLVQQLRRNAAVQVSVEGAGIELLDVYPSPRFTPQPGRMHIVTGRYRITDPNVNPTINVHTRLPNTDGNHTRKLDLPTDLNPAIRAAVPRLWARMHLHALEHQAWLREQPLPIDQARTIARTFGLVSPYTSLLAVDAIPTHDREPATPIHLPTQILQAPLIAAHAAP